MNRSMLVGTRVGVAAQRARDWLGLAAVARREPENLAGYASGLLAQQLMERLCRPGGTFVDVGAHYGSVIDGVARHSRSSAIIAVEAIPAKADALRRRFPRAVVHACAVGEESGELPFFIDVRRSGYSSLYRSDMGVELKEIHVPVRRLDELIGDEPVDLLKIDVEGAELAAMRGARSVIARDQPTIVFESGPGEEGGTKTDMWDWLDGAGYAVLVPERVAHLDPGLSRDGFVEAHLYPRRTTNYFAVARGRRDEVRARARAALGLAP